MDSVDYTPIEIPLGEAITQADRAISDQIVSREVAWGCTIVTGPFDGDSEIPVHGSWDPEARIDPDPDDVQIGVFAGPKKDWCNATTGIIFGCPRGDAPAAYLGVQGSASPFARVDFVLRNGHFTVKAVRDDDSDEEAFYVEIKPEEFLVRGHPWPFHPKNAAIGQFFWGRA